jgi:heptosyltransferase-2
MTGFRESVLPEAGRAILISPSWIGDALLAFPAVQALRRERPGWSVTVLAKPRVAPLWLLSRSVSQVLLQEPGLHGTRSAARRLKEEAFHTAWILPNSWRSAWIPWLASVPIRIGFAGHFRRGLLTDVRPRPVGAAPVHQSVEAARILGVDSGEPLGPAEVTIPEPILERIGRELSSFSTPRIILIPGAARGPSKRWPADRFAEAGRRLAAAWGGSVHVCGGAGELGLCEEVARAAGGCCWAGRTSLLEWAALLRLSQFVLCNDSGGMHLAAALGTPGIAVFGRTDPAVTGPLGGRIRVLRPEGNSPASRSIRRDDRLARHALESIPLDRVVSEAQAARDSGMLRGDPSP